MARGVRCWACRVARTENGRTCDPCRAEFAADRCRAKGCRQQGGNGQFGQMCSHHAEQLGAVAVELGNRRVRGVGELLENQIRVGLAQMSPKLPCRPFPEAKRAAPAAPSDTKDGKPLYHSLRIASRSVSPSCAYTERRSARMQS